jgi:hypothetical protein
MSRRNIYTRIFYFFVLLFSLTFTSCQKTHQSKNTAIFVGNEWYNGNELIFRNDSAISYSGYDTIAQKPINQVVYPLYLTDSTMIFTRYQQRGYYDQNRIFKISYCEKVIDTLRYDLSYINKRPKLIVYVDPFPLILTSKNQLDLPETQNFEPVKFLISDFSIGDQIDRSLLKTRGIYNYPNYTIEDCEFTENKDITFKIIGYNSIFSIERKRIEDYRIKDIVNVVTAKLKSSPEYRPMRQWVEGSNYEYEIYRWATHGVQIDLSRSRYVGSQSYKTLIDDNDWSLSYDDVILQAILIETYKNGRPQSSIIN